MVRSERQIISRLASLNEGIVDKCACSTRNAHAAPRAVALIMRAGLVLVGRRRVPVVERCRSEVGLNRRVDAAYGVTATQNCREAKP
jgi:hypothetical protein